jgi:hypothetical protein
LDEGRDFVVGKLGAGKIPLPGTVAAAKEKVARIEALWTPEIREALYEHRERQKRMKIALDNQPLPLGHRMVL